MEEGNEHILYNYKKFQELRITLRTIKQPPRSTPNCKGIWVSGTSGIGKDYVIRNAIKTIGVNFYEKGQNKWFDNY